jgi:tripartite-type tricarboxylate transporter receptor subunit TctC
MLLRRLPPLLAALAAAVAAAAPNQAAAQTYPTRPITLVVPAAAGGPTDTVARLIAEPMGRTLGQQMVVENVGGAGGTIGAARVAKAAGDGYTLYVYHIGQSTAPSLYDNLRYDVVNDFDPIGRITDVPMTIVGKKDLAAKDIGELIAWLKQKQTDVTYAHAGAARPRTCAP